MTPLAISGTRAWGWASLFALGALLLGVASTPQAQTDASSTARIFEIDGPIGPPLADYLVDGIEQANEDGASLIILEMDTPGGLDASMRRIIKAILSSSVPVASYVSPSGARAASAGTYILYASHIAAMAPGTNLGAATPVQIGGGLPMPGEEDDPLGTDKPKPATPKDSNKDAEDAVEGPQEDAIEDGEEDVASPMSNDDSMRVKVINDATAYIKGLAKLRGRNEAWAIKAVREAASLTAEDAAKQNVVDFVAVDLADLLAQSDGREVDVKGTMQTVASAGAVIERESPDWATKFLAAITDPNVAFLLMTIGFYGLFFELANPGSIVPGTFGAISLILGLYALSVLPVSMAGAALIILGLVLMIAEAISPSFGALGIGGLAAFALGATFLIDTEAPGFSISWPVIVGATAVTGLFMLTIMTFALGAQRRRVETGTDHLVRQHGHVESWDGDHGWVIVMGERWKATSEHPLEPGQEVQIKKVDGLTLVVEPVKAPRKRIFSL